MSDLTVFTKAFAKAFFKDENVNILEAGAANAHDTNFFCSEMRNAQIYAFEPDPRFHDALREMANKYDNLKFNTSALSKDDGFVEFHLSTRIDENNNKEVWGSSSILKPKVHLQMHPQIKFDEQPLRVPCVNLDAWMKRSHVDKFDMMWLDLQGYEYDVVSTSPNSLNNCKLLYTEVNLLENYEGNVLYEKFRGFLEDRDFLPFIEELPWKDAGNVLFVKKGNLDRAKSTVEMITK